MRELRKAALGEAHPDVAESLNNLGMAHMGLGNHEKAGELFKQALKK